MSVSQIDEAILSAVGQRWMKVAMVIAKVEESVGSELPLGDERLDLISGRIENLVRDGFLASQGNVQNWRFSEVCRAGNSSRPASVEAQPKLVISSRNA
jgi:hypothetical protein